MIYMSSLMQPEIKCKTQLINYTMRTRTTYVLFAHYDFIRSCVHLNLLI